MRKCIDCLQELPESSFTKSGAYLRTYCRDCSNARSRAYAQSNKARRNERLRAWRKANPEAARAKDLRARLRSKYGLTPADVEAMKVAQGGRCAICSVSGDLNIDHCHRTGKVRGLLCASCNTFLGRVEANPDILPRMAGYAGHELAHSSNTSA